MQKKNRADANWKAGYCSNRILELEQLIEREENLFSVIVSPRTALKQMAESIESLLSDIAKYDEYSDGEFSSEIGDKNIVSARKICFDIKKALNQ